MLSAQSRAASASEANSRTIQVAHIVDIPNEAEASVNVAPQRREQEELLVHFPTAASERLQQPNNNHTRSNDTFIPLPDWGEAPMREVHMQPLGATTPKQTPSSQSLLHPRKSDRDPLATLMTKSKRNDGDSLTSSDDDDDDDVFLLAAPEVIAEEKVAAQEQQEEARSQPPSKRRVPAFATASSSMSRSSSMTQSVGGMASTTSLQGMVLVSSNNDLSGIEDAAVGPNGSRSSSSLTNRTTSASPATANSNRPMASSLEESNSNIGLNLDLSTLASGEDLTFAAVSSRRNMKTPPALMRTASSPPPLCNKSHKCHSN